MVAEQPQRARTFPHTDAVLTRVDWFRLLAELLKAGRPLTAVARDTSIPRSTVQQWWYEHSEPTHYRGERLIAYWMTVTGKSRDSVPRTRRYSRPS